MKTNIVNLGNKKEPIFVGSSILREIRELLSLETYSKIAVLTDKNIASYWLKQVNQGIGKPNSHIIIPTGEKTKTIKTVEKIWREMIQIGLDRSSLLINLGGGVIGDMGGFIASTFMRGIDFINIPTTLLAMVDASIGGKTAVDFNGIKNSIGTFSSPVAVVIDIDMLLTLPKRELRASFAEIIKHGIISRPKYFDFVTSKKPEEFSERELLEIIKGSIRIKKHIVDNDPKEKGLRKTLNFGHTIGHAIEALSLETKNPLLHGEAIAIGMIAESKLAELSKLLSPKDFSRIEAAIENSGLPTKIKNISTKDIVRKIQTDKKNRSGKILWTLPKKIGKVEINVEVLNENIKKSLAYALINNQSVSLPGSKSLTNRALVMAALSKGKSTISNASVSADSLIMVEALKKLGIKIVKKKNFLEVEGNGGNFPRQKHHFNIGHAGTSIRFLTAVCSLVPGEIILDGSQRMRERPIGELVVALKKLGAEIEYLEKNEFLPLKIHGGKLLSGNISVKGSVSSQFFTALLLIAPVVKGINIQIIGDQVSKSYIDMTIDAMKKFGVAVKNNNYKQYSIDKNQTYKPCNFEVEGDASGGSYFWAIAAITGKKIKVKNLNPHSVQGDAKFPNILKRMGCKVEKNNKENSITVKGPEKLKGINIDMNSMPDTIQTLAVVSAFARGTTKITGAKTLRIKETDRLHALQTELQKMNIETQIDDNSITIKGGNPIGAEIKTYNDHRMVMSFAIAGAKIKGMKIQNPKVVSKSFPDFWKKLKSL